MLPLSLLPLVLAAAPALAKANAPLPIQTHLAPTGRPVQAFEQKHYFHQIPKRQLSLGGLGGLGTTADTTTPAADTSSAATGTTSPAASTSSPAGTTSDPATSTTPTVSSTTPVDTSSQTSQTSTPSTPPSSSSPSSTLLSSSGTSTVATQSSSSGTSSKAASSSSVPSSSVHVSTITSVVTDSNGVLSTSTGTTSSTAVADKSNKSTSGTGKTWGIVGGVVGGVVLLLGIVFVVYRMTQRRFGNLDDDGDEIRWPELQPDGQTIAAGASTLNPLGTRPTGRAGVEMSERDGSEWGGDGDVSGGELGGARYHSRASSYEPVHYSDNPSGSAGPDGAYYDPYLGPSAAPYPPPQALYPPTRSPSQLQYSNSASSYNSAPSGASNSTSYSSHELPPLPTDPFASHADAYPIAPPSDRRMSTVRESIIGEVRPTSPASLYRSGSVLEEAPPLRLGVVNADA